MKPALSDTLDDHLRNHGFLLGETGWMLAPAFDVNPNIDKDDHVLNIDDTDNRSDLRTVISTASFYGLSHAQAVDVVESVVAVVDDWQACARSVGLSNADIAGTQGAFSAHTCCRALSIKLLPV
ncbi:MAG: HipA domain-containing protein [Rhodoferax sp.]|nr:HipA domain-containing protein [Rhodoferax sp.]